MERSSSSPSFLVVKRVVKITETFDTFRANYRDNLELERRIEFATASIVTRVMEQIFDACEERRNGA